MTARTWLSAVLVAVAFAAACGDDDDPPPAARKPSRGVTDMSPGSMVGTGGEGSGGEADPMIRADGSVELRDGGRSDGSVPGGGMDGGTDAAQSPLDASSTDPDAMALPMPLRDGGPRAGGGGVGGIGGLGGIGGVGAIGGFEQRWR
jgi:hypothetical protein